LDLLIFRMALMVTGVSRCLAESFE
jgi:hypothetical protein